MQDEREREPVDSASKKRGDLAVDWLRATLQRRLGRRGDYGVIVVEIKLQDGQIPGSVRLLDELHAR